MELLVNVRKSVAVKFMKTAVRVLLTFAVVGIAACCLVSRTPPSSTSPTLVTSNASPETLALYRNLANLSGEFLLFGHQNTTAYGVNWINEPDRSDVKDITGSYPALFGWDIGELETGATSNLDGISFSFIREQIKASYRRGAVSTISWHMRDPITGGSSWDKAPSVAKLIPGGEEHHKLKQALDRFVEFNRTLSVTNSHGKAIAVPVIFRPWHEHNGDWFWWGKGDGLTSERDYIELWRFTVDYLREQKGQTNLIYAFSPDRSRMNIETLPGSYFYGYPGDDYVDIIGLDNYWDLGHKDNKASPTESLKNFQSSLAAIGQIAKAKGKVAAITEGGQEAISQDNFWTHSVLDSVMANDDTRAVVLIMVWRNANRATEQREHFYAPFKGHSSELDFIKFYQHPATLFENDLPNLYK